MKGSGMILRDNENPFRCLTANRITSEKKTVELMIRMYCRATHRTSGCLCEDCEKLLIYARERLEKCPYQEGKTVCSRCSVHCFKKEMREKIREVMRFAGPGMIIHHPIAAIIHGFHALRQKPEKMK